MNKAIVFRFYKEPEICLNRLELLKRYNPQTKIFGLYGGPQDESKIYQKKLGKFLDDFYISPYTDSYRKRRNGDLMIAERYTTKGRHLQRDSIYVIQRDMLVFDKIEAIFPDYQKDQFYIPGTRILDKNIEKRWHWTSKKSEKLIYEEFKKLIREKYGYTKKLLCSLATFSIFPRIFLEKYSKLEDNLTGFLEYKMPTYAKIFGLELYKKDTGIRRCQTKGNYPQNAIPQEIRK